MYILFQLSFIFLLFSFVKLSSIYILSCGLPVRLLLAKWSSTVNKVFYYMLKSTLAFLYSRLVFEYSYFN